MNGLFERGELYYADLGQGIGSEQEGRRPVVIVQNNVGNKHSPTVIIAPVSSKMGAKAKQPTHYYINNVGGIELPSIILCEQLRTIDKQRLKEYIGSLDKRHIRGINHALAISVGLVEQVPEPLVLCLCHVCASNFYGAGPYTLKRIATKKDTCTYCNNRQGYDYKITKK